MAIADNARRVTRAAGVASTAAPYIRRVMSDEQVRDDLRAVTAAAGRLFGELSGDDRVRRLVTDDRLRRDVDEILEAVQDAGRRVIEPRHRVDWSRILFWGAAAGAVAALFAVPQSRAAIRRWFGGLRDQTPSRSETPVGDAESPLSAAA